MLFERSKRNSKIKILRIELTLFFDSNIELLSLSFQDYVTTLYCSPWKK